jgi:putative ABC transport system permease protein
LYLNSRANYSLLSVKIRPGNLQDSIKFLEEEVKKFSPQYPFEYSFFDEVFDRAYRAERKMESLFNIFAAVSIFISCIGLFGLSLFMTEQRTSEIGIRKVFGASVSGITLLLSREFIRWLVLANIVAWPVSYYFMRQWLQNFTYRTGLGIRIFLFSGILALFVALLTVSYQSIKAALANPIDSIRYE